MDLMPLKPYLHGTTAGEGAVRWAAFAVQNRGKQGERVHDSSSAGLDVGQSSTVARTAICSGSRGFKATYFARDVGPTRRAAQRGRPEPWDHITRPRRSRPVNALQRETN